MAYISEKPGIGIRLSPIARTARPAARPARKHKAARGDGTFSYGLPLLALFFLLWEIAPRLGWLNPIFFPPLSDVCRSWIGLAESGVLAKHIGISLQRAAIGRASCRERVCHNV